MRHGDVMQTILIGLLLLRSRLSLEAERGVKNDTRFYVFYLHIIYHPNKTLSVIPAVDVPTYFTYHPTKPTNSTTTFYS